MRTMLKRGALVGVFQVPAHYLGQPLEDEAGDWYEDRSASVTAGWK